MTAHGDRHLVVLAGGLGSRLKATLGDIPKAMVPVGGKPLLERQIEIARRDGFREIHLLTHYKADVIEGHFGSGERLGVRITYHATILSGTRVAYEGDSSPSP